MNTVAIAGVGLIGGSFALALRKAGFKGAILGVSRPATIDQAKSAGVIDRGVTIEEAAESADWIYLAQPIQQILETINVLGPRIRPGTLVTDAGSTKLEIVERARAALPEGTFLGGHPMAGKEIRGVGGADATLFKGRNYILTPTAPEPAGLNEFRGWVEKMGARILVLTPAQHDAAVALTSHLPQLASTALGITVSNRIASPDHLRAAGPGLIDMTRLAMSSYDIWSDILATNPQEIRQALEAYIATLQEIRDALPEDGMEMRFLVGAALARRIR